MVLHHYGSRRRVVHQLQTADRGVPLLLAGNYVERDQMTVRRFKVEGALIDSHTTIADEQAALVVPVIAPQLRAGPGIYGPNHGGNGEVHDAVHQQRSGFNAHSASTGNLCPERPGELKFL